MSMSACCAMNICHPSWQASPHCIAAWAAINPNARTRPLPSTASQLLLRLFISCCKSSDDSVSSQIPPPAQNPNNNNRRQTPTLDDDRYCMGKEKTSALRHVSIGNRQQHCITQHAFATMTHPGFAHLWMQADLSDVDIVLSVVPDQAPTGDETAEAQSSNPAILQQFPGHSTIISSSPYFAAQAST